MARVLEYQSSAASHIFLMEQLHTVEQAAHLLQLHPDTIRLWLRTGRLKGHKLGRVWRVPNHELRRLSEAPIQDSATEVDSEA